jgi:AAA+ superfamily predicted ATPase
LAPPQTSNLAPSLAQEVLACFLHSPRIADSLEGIVRFRIDAQAAHRTMDEVRDALEWLVERDFLVKTTPLSGAPIFRLNEQRVAEAGSFIEHPARAVTAAAKASAVDADLSGHDPRRALLDSDVMSVARRWLDAVFTRYHRRYPPADDDLPGLTRSASVLDVLLTSATPADLTALRDQDQRVEEAARDLHRVLRRTSGREPLARLMTTLGLSDLEVQVLVLCLAPELDVRYQVICGLLNDDLGRRAPTLGLICSLLGDPIRVRRELTVTGNLSKWQLLDGSAVLPYADSPLRLDPPVVAWLFGQHRAFEMDPVLAGCFYLEPLEEVAARTWRGELAESSLLEAAFGELTERRQWLLLSAGSAELWRPAVAQAAADAGVAIAWISPAGLDRGGGATQAGECSRRVVRAVLLSAAVAVFDLSELSETSAPSACTNLMCDLASRECVGIVIAPEPHPALVALPRGHCSVVQAAPRDPSTLSHSYQRAALATSLALSREDAEWLAMTFPFPMRAIDQAIRLAELATPQGTAPSRSVLSDACRRVAAPNLPQFARRIESAVRLAEVVLPADRKAQLVEIVAHLRFAAQVLNSWGFGAQLPYGRGVAALFHGPSGTGKTMAAHAIANELGTTIYQVDLSRVINKYVGESEKHLDAVFTDAERAGAVLLFDEADALFGKRTEIKGSQEHYANNQIAYLLQRMEAFLGLAILTTNLRQNIDQGFVRRLRFSIEFPRPDAAAREDIWRRCLPKEAPLASDVSLRVLAKRLEITGGNIRQVTLRAAFAAAAERCQAIEMRHIVGATLAELRKLGMPNAERDLAQLEHLRSQGIAVVG